MFLSTFFFFSVALIGLLSNVAYAEADKVRVIWNRSPDSCATIGWCQVKGEPTSVRYVELDEKREAIGEAVTRTVDHTTTHHGITSHFARLDDLKPGTLYQFFIVDSEGEGDAMTFRTAPAEPSAFSFVAGGDSRNHRDARKRANRTVALLRPLFVCFGGDMINRSNGNEWREWLDDWGLTKGADGHMTPIVAARGNHEGKGDIHAFFDTPNADDFYALGFGGGYFRVYTLNSTITRAGSQGEWLAKDLAENEDNRWKIAHYHHPFFPHQSGKKEQHAQYNAWAPPFFLHGLNLAIECDSHVVKRTWPLRPSNEPGSDMGFIRDDKFGTTFIGEGCWGAPLRAADDPKSWTRAKGRFNSVHWVVVTPEKMWTRAVKVDSIDGVTGQIDPADPIRAPEGLEIWEPENGPIVTILPRGEGVRVALPESALARVKIVAANPKFTGTTKIRIELEGVSSKEGYQIRYTLDGNEPGADSPAYTAPFDIDKTTTVRAALFSGGKMLTEPTALTATKKGGG